MANLNDVKVGDRVWLCQFNHRQRRDKRLNLDTVVRVTAKKFAVARHSKDLYDKRTGRTLLLRQHRHSRRNRSMESPASPSETRRGER